MYFAALNENPFLHDWTIFPEEVNHGMPVYVDPYADITLESLMQEEPPSIESMIPIQPGLHWGGLFDQGPHSHDADRRTVASRR